MGLVVCVVLWVLLSVGFRGADCGFVLELCLCLVVEVGCLGAPVLVLGFTLLFGLVYLWLMGCIVFSCYWPTFWGFVGYWIYFWGVCDMLLLACLIFVVDICCLWEDVLFLVGILLGLLFYGGLL